MSTPQDRARRRGGTTFIVRADMIAFIVQQKQNVVIIDELVDRVCNSIGRVELMECTYVDR